MENRMIKSTTSAASGKVKVASSKLANLKLTTYIIVRNRIAKQLMPWLLQPLSSCLRPSNCTAQRGKAIYRVRINYAAEQFGNRKNLQFMKTRGRHKTFGVAAHRVRRYIARLLSVVRNSQSRYLVVNQQFTLPRTASCCKLTFFTHSIYFRLKEKMLSALPDGQTLVLWLAASGALLHCTNMHGRDATSAEGCQTMRGRTACARNWHHC